MKVLLHIVFLEYQYQQIILIIYLRKKLVITNDNNDNLIKQLNPEESAIKDNSWSMEAVGQEIMTGLYHWWNAITRTKQRKDRVIH